MNSYMGVLFGMTTHAYVDILFDKSLHAYAIRLLGQRTLGQILEVYAGMLFSGTMQACAEMLFDRTMNTYVRMLVRLDKYAYGGVLFGEEMSTYMHGCMG